ncbi:PA2169 family four-helix-bundle protein [Dyella monticola]|uniref:PA2169 family four-helix-bundle protein n=1 Tax=Dyella monticola TaxID=1927958 RepID=A0A370WU80_9GAMM|nr:PA2169 family four-helix-bundle protein [Dyella monticola]RDS79505.1 PA2169 family four-helix-bundle protein [Dyella monticola]
MSSNNDDIAILNRLIEVTIDSAEGYGEAAKDARNPELKAIFQRRVDERMAAFHSLQSQVTALGGQPEDEGTLLASMHRAFVNLRATVQSGDLSVVDEVERGEDRIKAKYDDAIRSGELSASSLAAVEQAYESVRSGHDEMSQLKHSLHRLHG